MNRLIQSSKKMQRININPQSLLIRVIIWMSLIIVFLVVWTVYDAPAVEESRHLNQQDTTIVSIDRECKSEAIFWEVAQASLQALLLLICAIFAFQSRHSVSIVNDSRVLAQLVYSHFMFMILRLMVTAFDLFDVFDGSIVSTLASFNHSFDALFAMCIYVSCSKVYQVWPYPSDTFPIRSFLYRSFRKL
jgi:hypothetical protein